jgi:hypothetical protein
MSFGRAKWWAGHSSKGYAGYHDWRLPTLEEAASLLQFDKNDSDLYIDPVFSDKQKWIWTGDSKDGSEAAWNVYFGLGSVDWGYHIYGSYGVRPVRSVLGKDVNSSYQSGRDTGQVQVTPQQEPSYKTYSDGSKYVGTLVGGRMSGQGTYTWPDGEKYVGEFKRGKQHGQGTYTWATGGKYVGEFKNDKRTGQGTYTWPDGTKYVGEFKNDKEHGQGTQTWGRGSEWAGDKYVGEYKSGKQHGQGTYTWATGGKYVGEYKRGKQHGQGTYTWATGGKYVGEWKNDKKHGQGTRTWPDGEKYVGEWKDGLANGGRFYWADGHTEWSYQDSAGNWHK